MFMQQQTAHGFGGPGGFEFGMGGNGPFGMGSGSGASRTRAQGPRYV